MIRRIIAAAAALMLSALGVFLVMSYASSADERARADLETVDVLVATADIARGTSEDLGTLLEVQQVPRAYVVPGALDALIDVDGLVAADNLARGQQVRGASFVTAQELRGSGDYVLPEEAQHLHQLTINVPHIQALGGSVAAGDTVGIFATFSMNPPNGWEVAPDGGLRWNEEAARARDTEAKDEEDSDSSGQSITFTDLVLDKALVVRVENGTVDDSTASDGAADEHADQEQTEAAGRSGGTVEITVALEPQDAARVIQTMRTGSVWLTLSPQDAQEADIDAVIPGPPSRVMGVLE